MCCLGESIKWSAQIFPLALLSGNNATDLSTVCCFEFNYHSDCLLIASQELSQCVFPNEICTFDSRHVKGINMQFDLIIL